MKLYEITKEVKAFEELYLECIDEETGEIKNSEVLEELQKGIEKELEKKSSGLIKYFKNEESTLETIDEEIKRLHGLKKAKEKKIKDFKNFVIYNLSNMGVKKIETELGNLSLRTSKAVEILNEELIPKEFITEVIEKKISKADIKKALDSGVEVAGATIKENLNLQIK